MARLLTLTLIAALSACAVAEGPDARPSLSAPLDDGAPTLGKLETQREVLIFQSGIDGPRYSVTTRDGQVLSRDIGDAELSARHQELHQLLRTGTAAVTGDAPFLDASLDHDATADR